jgi:hypothetical protein
MEGGEMHTENVNIDKAEHLLKEMQAKLHSSEVAPLVDKAIGEMKDLLHGLILTAVETGLVENTPSRLEELRMKITVAFSSGFMMGRESK